MNDRRSQVRAQVKALADAGKSADEIRAIVRGQMGPTADAPYSIARDNGETPSMPASSAPAPPEADSPGLLDTLVGLGKTAAKAPGEIAANPAAAPRALETGAVNAATLGRAKDLHGPAMERMRAKLDAGGLEPGDLQTLSMWQDAANPGRERAPITDPKAALDELQGIHRQVQDEAAAMPGTQFLGGMAIAPATLQGRAASAVGGLVGKVPGLGDSALGRVVGASGGGYAGGAAGSAVADMVGGNTEGMEGRANQSGMLGALLAGVPAAVGETARGAGNAIVNSKGGQARQLIESARGKVGVLSSGESGPFGKGGRLEGRKPTDADIGAAARESAGNILNRIKDTHAAEAAPATAELNRLDAVFPEQMVDASGLADQVAQLARHSRLSPAQQSTVKLWEDRLQRWVVNDPKTGKYAGIYMPAGELNALKGLMQDATNVGALGAASVPTEMQRGAPALAKTLVDSTDYGPPNAQAHDAHVRAEAQRRLLRLPDQEMGGANTPEGLPRSEVEHVTNLMARQGQNTVTAGGQNASVAEDAVPGAPARASLQQLAEQFPQHAQDVRMPQVLQAKGDLDFTLLGKGDKGGLIARAKSAGPALASIAAAGAGGAAGHPLLGALLGAGGLAAMNAEPIAGRLLYTPARAARAAGGALSDAARSGVPGALAGSMDPLQALLDGLEEKNKQKRKAK